MLVHSNNTIKLVCANFFYYKLFYTFKIVGANKDVRWKSNIFEKPKPEPKPGLHRIELETVLVLGLGMLEHSRKLDIFPLSKMPASMIIF